MPTRPSRSRSSPTRSLSRSARERGARRSRARTRRSSTTCAMCCARRRSSAHGCATSCSRQATDGRSHPATKEHSPRVTLCPVSRGGCAPISRARSRSTSMRVNPWSRGSPRSSRSSSRSCATWLATRTPGISTSRSTTSTGTCASWWRTTGRRPARVPRPRASGDRSSSARRSPRRVPAWRRSRTGPLSPFPGKAHPSPARAARCPYSSASSSWAARSEDPCSSSSCLRGRRFPTSRSRWPPAQSPPLAS